MANDIGRLTFTRSYTRRDVICIGNGKKKLSITHIGTTP